MKKRNKKKKKSSLSNATTPIEDSSMSKTTKGKSGRLVAKIIEDLDKVFGLPSKKTNLDGLSKETPSSKSKSKKSKVVFNDEQFEAHCLDSISQDMKKWNIPWFVGVLGKPNSDNVKVVVAGKPATIDEDKSGGVLYMKSLMTIAAMVLEDTLNDKNQGYDIIDG